MGWGPSRRSLWLGANDQISDLMTGWSVWEKPLPAFLSAQVLQGLESQGPVRSMAQNHSLSQEKSGEALQRPRGQVEHGKNIWITVLTRNEHHGDYFEASCCPRNYYTEVRIVNSVQKDTRISCLCDWKQLFHKFNLHLLLLTLHILWPCDLKRIIFFL